jgi:hypothetical protein
MTGHSFHRQQFWRLLLAHNTACKSGLSPLGSIKKDRTGPYKMALMDILKTEKSISPIVVVR